MGGRIRVCCGDLVDLGKNKGGKKGYDHGRNLDLGFTADSLQLLRLNETTQSSHGDNFFKSNHHSFKIQYMALYIAYNTCTIYAIIGKIKYNSN